MARVHCVDCGTDVAVDPLGQCPEGHLLPATGSRVSTAIGSDEPYPDEPVPWVGQVVLDGPAEPAEPVVAGRIAQPSAAPGLAPAERETVPGDLLRELGDLSNDSPGDTPGPAPSAPAPAAAPRPDAPPPSTAQVGNGHAPTNGHAPSNGHAPVAGGPAPVGDDATSGAELSEFSALEQAIQSLETGSTGTGAPAPQASAPADLDDDLGRLFDELDGLGDDARTGPATGDAAAATPPPPVPSTPPATDTPPPAHPGSSPPPTAPAPGAPQWEARAEIADAGAAPGGDASTHAEAGPTAAAPSEAPAPPARPAIDTMNFTARGGPTKSRRRRLLGR